MARLHGSAALERAREKLEDRETVVCHALGEEHHGRHAGRRVVAALVPQDGLLDRAPRLDGLRRGRARGRGRGCGAHRAERDGESARCAEELADERYLYVRLEDDRARKGVIDAEDALDETDVRRHDDDRRARVECAAHLEQPRPCALRGSCSVCTQRGCRFGRGAHRRRSRAARGGRSRGQGGEEWCDACRRARMSHPSSAHTRRSTWHTRSLRGGARRRGWRGGRGRGAPRAG